MATNSHTPNKKTSEQKIPCTSEQKIPCTFAAAAAAAVAAATTTTTTTTATTISTASLGVALTTTRLRRGHNAAPAAVADPAADGLLVNIEQNSNNNNDTITITPINHNHHDGNVILNHVVLHGSPIRQQQRQQRISWVNNSPLNNKKRRFRSSILSVIETNSCTAAAAATTTITTTARRGGAIVAFALVVLCAFSFFVIMLLLLLLPVGSIFAVVDSGGNQGKHIFIMGSRHPVVEQYNDKNSSIKNNSIKNKNNNKTMTSSSSAFQLYSIHAPTSCSDPPTHAAENISFTLVTQFSDDRLWMMQYHCERWGRGRAPISIVVYTTNQEDHHLDVDHVTQQLDHLGCDTDQIQIQTVSSSSSSSPSTDHLRFSLSEYPVNHLRNMALSVVQTTHVLYVDVDFWPSQDLYTVLHSNEIRSALAKDDRLALVVPAFQLNRQCREWRDCWERNIPMMPRTKQELIALLLQSNHQQASQFHPKFVAGHGSTRYDQWYEQGTNELIPIPCIRSNHYEPYLAFRYCQSLPPFQESFTGYGKNKMTWMMHLRRAGYRLEQISAFLIHYPHLASVARKKFNQGPLPSSQEVAASATSSVVDWQKYKRGKVDATFVQFRKWLAKEVPNNATRVPRCVDAQDDDSRLWINRPIVK